jgi:hypothetical protein
MHALRFIPQRITGGNTYTWFYRGQLKEGHWDGQRLHVRVID